MHLPTTTLFFIWLFLLLDVLYIDGNRQHLVGQGPRGVSVDDDEEDEDDANDDEFVQRRRKKKKVVKRRERLSTEL